MFLHDRREGGGRMRMLVILLLAVTTQAAETIQFTDEQLGEKLAQAIVLARAGLYGEAEVLCKQILAQKPYQPTVNQLLREIEQQRAKYEAQDPGYALKRTLRETVVPEVKFREAA